LQDPRRRAACFLGRGSSIPGILAYHAGFGAGPREAAPCETTVPFQENGRALLPLCFTETCRGALSIW